MTKEEIICGWMEPKPAEDQLVRVDGWWESRQGWWRFECPHQILPAELTLERLHEVEARFTDDQCAEFERALYSVKLRTKPKPRIWFGWHTTADQKIKALVLILRRKKAKVVIST